MDTKATERHAELLGEFLALPGMHGNLVPMLIWPHLAVEHGLTLCSTDGNCDTLGPWSDFIKEFGFVLPKHQTKMQMWAHDRRRSAVQLKTAVLLLRETATRSSILSLTSRLAIRLRTTSMAFCQMSVE